MNDGFWCEYCGKQKAWDDRDYDFGLYLAEMASFEALGHTEYVTPYLICEQCADEAKKEAQRMSERKAWFGIKVDRMSKDQWSFGICLSHWWKETYLFINLFKWSISIGWLLMPDKEAQHE